MLYACANGVFCMKLLDIAPGMWMVDKLFDMFANDMLIFLRKFPDELLCTILDFDLHKEPRLQIKFFFCFFP